jgi:hypothetical protein
VLLRIESFLPVELGSIDYIFQPSNRGLVVCNFNFDRNVENVGETV